MQIEKPRLSHLRIAVFVLMILSAVSWCVAARAQDVRDHVTVAPPGVWVEAQAVPAATFDAAARLKTSYKLASYQDEISKTDRNRYRRFAFKMLTNSSIEDNGTISVTFDPEYQDIIFHHIRVTSDGVTRDALDLDAMEIFRSETDRERLMFNGQLTVSLALKGLKRGDTIDYGYTRTGLNPVLRGGYFDGQTQEYSIPTQRLFARLILRDNLPVHVKAHDGGTLPLVEQRGGGVTWVTHIGNDVPGFTMDENIPSFAYGFPLHVTSSYDDWADVGDVFASLYPRTRTAEISGIAAAIRAEHTTTAAQARAALDYVQSNIRYLALSMGTGGFDPNPPTLVLERRYGDCKDVTLLLLSILSALNIQADPLLVHTGMRGKVFDLQPSHTAFNHIVVIARIRGENYVMDATSNPQLGDLDHYDQFDYGRGLRLRPGASKVMELPSSTYAWRKDIVDTFDVTTDDDDVLFTTVGQYFGTEADYIVNWKNSDGLAAIDKRYLDYYRDIYPTIEVVTPTEFDIDADTARLTTTTVYRIPDAWSEDEEDDRDYFRMTPAEAQADTPKFVGADRTTPYAISFPIRTRHQLKLLATDAYSFDSFDLKYKSDAIAYEVSERPRRKDNSLTETYSFITMQDHIALEDYAEDMAEIKKFRGRMGTRIYRPSE